jgi:hypothetical protein
MKRLLLPALIVLSGIAFGSIAAQSPAPVIIQAVSPRGPAPAATAAPAPASVAGANATLQDLQEMQATNAATIKKQEAALQTLDSLQKAAEEIKIYSKRG